MAQNLEPDPTLIGGVPTPPFAFLPEPVKLFQTRARRFAFLAESNPLAPYLAFLAELSRLQARLAATLRPVSAIAPMRVTEAARSAMPPIDRLRISADPALGVTLDAFVEGAAGLSMPDPARLALDAVRAAEPADRIWLLSNILSDRILLTTAPLRISSPPLRYRFTWQGSPLRSMPAHWSLSEPVSVPPAADAPPPHRSWAHRASRMCATPPAPAAPPAGTKSG